jgi:hypothetical protein
MNLKVSSWYAGLVGQGTTVSYIIKNMKSFTITEEQAKALIYWVERTKDDMEEFAYQHEEHCRILWQKFEVKDNPQSSKRKY